MTARPAFEFFDALGLAGFFPDCGETLDVSVALLTIATALSLGFSADGVVPDEFSFELSCRESSIKLLYNTRLSFTTAAISFENASSILTPLVRVEIPEEEVLECKGKLFSCVCQLY